MYCINIFFLISSFIKYVMSNAIYKIDYFNRKQ